MSDKKFLIKKLMEYPNITNDEYISLVKERNNLLSKHNHTNNNIIFTEIDNKIDIYNEKQMIINLIKRSPINSPVESCICPPSFFRASS